jgi:hypothetical protein
MKYALLLSTIAITSCQNGSVTLTPQQQNAGIAALSSVLNSVAKDEKPKQAAIEAAKAALDAYQATPSPSAP